MSDTQDVVQGGFEVLKWDDLTPEEQDRWVKLAWVFSAPPDDGPGLVPCLECGDLIPDDDTGMPPCCIRCWDVLESEGFFEP